MSFGADRNWVHAASISSSEMHFTAVPAQCAVIYASFVALIELFERRLFFILTSGRYRAHSSLIWFRLNVLDILRIDLNNEVGSFGFGFGRICVLSFGFSFVFPAMT